MRGHVSVVDLTSLSHSPITVRLYTPSEAKLVRMYSVLTFDPTYAVHVYCPSSLRASGEMERVIPRASPGPIITLVTTVSVSTPVLLIVTSQLITRPVVP